MLTHLNDKTPASAGGSINDLTRFTINALIVWRVASFLTFRSTNDKTGLLRLSKETGPFEIFDKFRDMIGMHFNDLGAAWQQEQPNELAAIFTCMFCSTTWIGFIVAIANRKGLHYGLALSTAAIAIEKYIRG